MVTIQERAVQIQRARVEARPITRTEQKKLEVIQRQKRIPPPQVEIQKPSPEQERQRQEQERQRQEQEQLQKDWYGLRVMLSKGKPKSGYGAKALAMYTATRMETSHFLDALKKKGTITAQEEKILRKIHFDYRVSIGARTYLGGSVTRIGGRTIITSRFPVTSAVKPVFGPQLPREGDPGFIGPVQAKYVPPTPPPTPPPTTYFPSETKITRVDLAPKMEQEIRFVTELPKYPEAMPIDIKTGKPFGKVEVAPTKWERYKEGVKERGPVTTTWRFIASEVQDVLTEAGLGRAGKYKDIPLFSFQEPYQPYALGRFGKEVVEKTPYITPIGPYLLVSTGAERLAFKGGREELKYMGEQLYEKTEMPFTKYLPYGLPIAEIGLGTLGISKQVKGFKAEVELKKLGETPLKVKGYRFEAGDRGFDILTGMKKVGKAKYVVKLKQPYYMTREGKAFLLESGKLEAFRIKPAKFGKIKVDMKTFEVTGRGYIVEGVAKRVVTGKGYTIKTELFDVQKALGVTRLKGKMQFTGKIDYGVKFPKAELFAKIKGKAKPFVDIQRIKFLGIGKGEKIIKTINADIDKLYYNIVKDQFRITGKITSYGKIKRITPSDFGVDVDKGYTIFAGGGKKSSQAFFQSLYANQQNVMDTALKSVASSIKPAFKTPSIISDISKPISQAKLEKQIKLIMEGKIETKVKLKKEIKAKPITSDAIISKTSQSLNQVMKQMEQQVNKSTLKTEQALGQVQRQRTKTAQLSGQKLLQRYRQTRVHAPAITFFPTTKFPIFTLPPSVVIPEIAKRKKKLKKKIKKLLGEEFLYTPSFTARAVGMKAIEISERQAQQLIKKVITGFEIRRPVRIKRRRKKK